MKDDRGTQSNRVADKSPSAPEYASPFASVFQTAFKARQTSRFAAAATVAVLVLLLLVWLGPEREEIKRRFEIYGAEGPLRIMPEISIDDGADTHHQLPVAYRDLPPPPPLEVLPEDSDPEAAIEVPAPRETEEVLVEDADTDSEADPDLAQVDQVQLSLPRQSSSDFIITKMVRPLYPLSASEVERRTAVIQVNVAIFVDSSGLVTASMIMGNNGSARFGQVVLKAVNQWEFQWLTEDAVRQLGRWIEMSWRFKSPYGDFGSANGRGP
jgi:hypothetical protein